MAPEDCSEPDQKFFIHHARHETGANILHAYKQRFLDDPAATNLEQWQIFENDNPDTFYGMYQFWIQKMG